MKHLISVMAAAAIFGSAAAQTGFTIRRPADGAKVRETVVMRFPGASIPEDGYLGIYINGKFIEAVKPEMVGDEYIYRLDTKARKLDDGEHEIEAVLFVDFGERPRIVNRSRVRVTVDNYTSISIPANGLNLRYTFTPGKEWKYALTQNQTLSFVSEALASVGGQGVELNLDTENFRVMYAVDNAYSTSSGREGLIRIQGLPDKGKDYAILTTSGNAQPRRYYSHEMHPLYMRISNTGREIFSAAPNYWPLEGTAGEAFRLDLYVVAPLPLLPSRAVSPGDSWRSGFLTGAFSLEEKDEIDKFMASIDGRGTLESVEWFNGRRTAKIRIIASFNADDETRVQQLNQVQGDTNKLEVEQVFWFDLDRGVIVRLEESRLQESVIDAAAPAAAAGGGGAAGPSAGPPAGGGQRRGGGRIAPQGFGMMRWVLDPHIDPVKGPAFFRQFGPPPGAGGGGAPAAGGGSFGPPPGEQGGPDEGGFGGGFGGATGQQTVRQVVRIRSQQIFELEN
jgi:hypothetical protein